MGPELADDRPDFAADGREWRTPPLWGVGLIETVNGHTLLLHDGRARGFAEAILWHGGEGEAAREAFRALPTRRARGADPLPGVAVNRLRAIALARSRASAIRRRLRCSPVVHRRDRRALMVRAARAAATRCSPGRAGMMLHDLAQTGHRARATSTGRRRRRRWPLPPRSSMRSPDAATLATAQSAWRRARAAWKQSEAFAIGPAETLRTVGGDRLVADPAPTASRTRSPAADELTADYVDGLGANVKGFLALEYLLFDPDGDDARGLQRSPATPRRRRFVRALAENLRDEAARAARRLGARGGQLRRRVRQRRTGQHDVSRR